MSRFEKIYLTLESPERSSFLMTTVTEVQALPEAGKVKGDIAALGELICNRCHASHSAELGANLIKYAVVVTQMDVEFLELLRDEIGNGLDAFDSLGAEMDRDKMQIQV